jgi:hypothetical protein
MELCRLTPSASPLEGAHHFPVRLAEKDFRRDDVGAALHAHRASHSDRADHGLDGDRNAALAPFAAHHLDVISFRSWHSRRVAREAVEWRIKDEG